MNDSEKIKKKLRKLIKENPESFPFIAQFWEIEIEPKENKIQTPLHFGKYKATMHTSFLFYKPFSKLMDLSKID